jgi:thiosulfate dehydrogenase (quinone) large subunit
MFMKWMRENVVAAGLLALIRVWFGWQWMTAGWGKITGGFDASGFLKGAIGKPVMSHGEMVYPTYTSFLESFALPNVKLINFLIPWGEFLVGVGLLLGCLTTAAIFFGTMMNFMFLLAGTVSSNPWYILWAIFILAAGYNAGRFGLDYYVIPYLRSLFNKKLAPEAKMNKA